MWLIVLSYIWTKPFALLVYCSLDFLLDSSTSRWASCWCYMRTFALVSGNRRATRPPPTSTDEAMRMGMAFVIPTREPKIRFPKTAASLHRALQNPKPVPLGGEKSQGQGGKKREKCVKVEWIISLFLCVCLSIVWKSISKSKQLCNICLLTS